MNTLPELDKQEILGILGARFAAHPHRHPAVAWADVEVRLQTSPAKLWSLLQMERTGGEPDVTGFDSETNTFVYTDCAPQSPKGRMSLCYDGAALRSRKAHKPSGSALDMAEAMGVELLTTEAYQALQALGEFDTKTSSWLQTPADIRKLGGAIFGDRRYGRVFIYHNGAESYYSSRGFRAQLRV